MPKRKVSEALPVLSHPDTGSKKLKTRVSLDGAGRVGVFGTGECAQLGLGDMLLERKFPMFVGRNTEMFESSIESMSAGGIHNAVVDTNGRVFTWGCNDEKALGREGNEWISDAVVEVISGERVVKVACGDSHTIALTEKGEVYAWGAYRDEQGLMGFNRDSNEPCVIPTRVTLPTRARIVDIVSGLNHSVILSSSGEIFEWGHIRIGQRIARHRRKGLLTPRLVNVKRFGKVVRVFAGGYQSFAITGDDRVFTWGLNQYGQAGTDSTEERLHKPVEVKALSGRGVVKITAGLHHSLALTSDGRVFSFGRNNYGELGMGNLDELRVPTQVPSLADIVDIACGSTHSLAVDQMGMVYSCGFGAMLQLGNGEPEDRLSFEPVVGKMLESGYAVVAADAGAQHSLILVRERQASG